MAEITDATKTIVISLTSPYVPPPPEEGGDPSQTAIEESLEAGRYNIVISKTDYETVYAEIEVSSSGVVSCNSVTGDGTCGGTGRPRVEVSGASVSVYMAGHTPSVEYEAWLASKGGYDGITVPDIIELRLAYLDSIDIGFKPTVSQIINCRLAYLN